MNASFIAQSIKKSIKKHARDLELIKFRLPWGCYKRIGQRDREHFGEILSTWQPPNAAPVYILHWLVTEWCNYACPYCEQTHDRHADKGGFVAHAFDNHPLEKWIDAFERHFEKRHLSIVLNGGESMQDWKNMVPLLAFLTSMPTTEWIRIDTNATWKSHLYKDLNKSKIILMCTFHPSQVTLDRFFGRIKEFLDDGFRIGMVNFVMNRENFSKYQEAKAKLAQLGIPLHPNPLWNSRGFYSDEDMEFLSQELPKDDYNYRTQTLAPTGKKCLYPALAYEMNQDGDIRIGCHPKFHGSFFDDALPSTFAGPVPCPAKACMCLDKYSFLEDVNRNTGTNPLGIYSDLLLSRDP